MKTTVNSRAIWRALTTVNSPLPIHIDADTLLACLLLRNTQRQWRPHVRAFFREVQAEVMMDMVIEGTISFEELSQAIRFWDVEEDIENVRWVREMTPRQNG
ncbi:hypothetical protein [Candidatus Phyllobacterium onerii]|uniref:hypothetical protein n=1 Tax=Candidatus Phyllobacterium onerii TaxID=3020828 RepID=UPI00232E55C4|nr:hypothetical protein [Phyllobacterium sp. IY22]